MKRRLAYMKSAKAKSLEANSPQPISRKNQVRFEIAKRMNVCSRCEHRL
jgi:hypothetical protein